jgi:CHAD domain-containing protein
MRRSSPSELLIRQRLAALTRALPAAQQGDVRSLHQARVATRRLREALPLVTTGDRQRKLDRKVRSLTRALGPVRELDVALQILEELEATPDVPRAAVNRLRQAVLEERRSLHGDMLRRLDRCNLEKLSKRAIAATRKTEGKKPSARPNPRQAAALRARVVNRAESLRAAMMSAAGLYLPDRLHEVRIAVKKLRYALELSGVVGRSRAEARIRTLRKAQDLLGRMHDLEVLIARTRGVQGSSSAPTLKLSGELDRLVRHLENECRQLHGSYITLRKTLLTLCDRVIADGHRRAASAA